VAAPRGSDPAPQAGRLRAPRNGWLARLSRLYARRRYGKELAPSDAYLHAPWLLAGYGAFEVATERAGRVEERLKLLAELRAAQVVGCEWCMDFGSMLGRAHAVPDRQLRELPRYRTSDAFGEAERLVIEYAEAMSRTPAEVGDELFARLRGRFDDAQLVELTNAIAIENLRARFNHALGFEPQGFSEGAACVVPDLALSGDRQSRAPDPVR
jgi:AhpD family alkylhydroperoxidase